jgi:hypothetical protein
MAEVMRYLITGLTIVGTIAPLAYCEVKREEARASIEIACIKAGGEWVRGWSPTYCKTTTATNNRGE